jgi:hypothetical protein
MVLLPMLVAFQLAAGPQAAPEKPVLVNNGAPMSVEFQCTDEDMAAAGLACPPDAPCDVYLELSTVETVGARIFLAGNVHTSSVTLHSILLATSDAGKTWSEPYTRIRGAALDQIQFLDFAAGWIGGGIVQPLPRDPFLLKTTDGGATWRRYPVFADNRPGSVDRFNFRTAADGLLWIDRSLSGDPGARYERYESATGGESWNLREAVSRLPPADGRETSAPGWRLRPDAASKSYRLERQTGDQWQAVASFLIPIGHCAASPPVLREPPQSEPPEPADGAQKKTPTQQRKK